MLKALLRVQLLTLNLSVSTCEDILGRTHDADINGRTVER